MKIEIELYGEKFTWSSDHDGYDVYTIAEKLKGLLVASGFHPNSVDQIFNSDAVQPYEDENNFEVDDYVDDEIEEHDDEDEDDIFSIKESRSVASVKELK
jgi:hypothetical protein